jgi:spore coat protein H
MDTTTLMNWTRRIVFSIFLIARCFAAGYGQSGALDRPDFPEVRIHIPDNQFKRLTSARGIKMDIRKARMVLNNDTVAIKELHSRGLTSLNFGRKSLAVDLDKTVILKNARTQQAVKRFDLINLEMDQYLWHSRWSYLSLSQLGLFPLFTTYCKVWINGVSQGIYLMVEKPNYFRERIGSPYMIRRGYDHKIDKAYSNKDSKASTTAFRKQYETLYTGLSNAHGEPLFKRIQERLMTDHYFRWLGFNYWVLNGDYSDELFLYVPSQSGRFDIIPWDYDDILKIEPHEGKEARKTMLADKMLFSTEDVLDRSIGSDDFLYHQYRLELKNTLMILSQEKIKATMDLVKEELASLARDPEVVAASRYLDAVPFDPGKAQLDMDRSYDFLILRRAALLRQLSEK